MKWIKYITLYGLTIFVFMVLVELYFQGSEIILPKVEVDPVLGEVYLPNKRVAEFFEGYYLGQINEHRYLGEVSHIRKSPDEVHVGLVGDSFVAGMELFPRHHFMQVMNKELNEGSSQPYIFTNFGKDGLNLSGIYSYYEKYVSTYEMDHILFFLNWENFWDTERQFTPNYELENGELVLKTDFTESGAYQTYDKLRPLTQSALVFLAYKCRTIINSGQAPRVLFDKFYIESTPDPNAIVEPEDESYKYELNEVKRAILKKLASDKKVILVIDDEIPQEINSVIQELGFRTIYLDGVIKEIQATGFDPYYWKVSGKWGHWNPPTHQIVGKYLSGELKKILHNSAIAKSK